MCRKNVDGGREYEKKEQRKVKDVPEPKEALIEGKGGRLLDGCDIQRHQFDDAGKPLSANLS